MHTLHRFFCLLVSFVAQYTIAFSQPEKLYSWQEYPEAYKNPQNVYQLFIAEYDSVIMSKLSSFPNLEALTIAHYSGKYFGDFWKNILPLKKLKKLELKGHELTEIPDELGTFTNLEHLSLSGNKLTVFPSAILHLRQLKYLDLSRNQIAFLPDSIHLLSSLQDLHLRSNRLQTIPPKLGELALLEQLDLAYNSIAFFPDAIFKLNNLKTLHLDNNKMIGMSDKILVLKKLEKLYLRCNQFSYIPDSIHLLTSLQVLDLYLNRVEKLPEKIGYLPQLTQLDCSFNFLHQIPESIGNLEQAKLLDFKYNNLLHRPWFYDDFKNKRNLILMGNLFEKERATKHQRIIQSIENVTDIRDGNNYLSVKIKEQRWMMENLRFASPNSATDSLQSHLGRFYTFSEKDSVCPAGWHTATTSDWRALLQEAHNEFPYDDDADRHEKIKELHRDIYDGREDRTPWFDPQSNTIAEYYATPYLSYPLRGMSRLFFNNFYCLNILFPKKRTELSIPDMTAFWAGGAGSNDLSILVFNGYLPDTKEISIKPQKINDTHKYAVRCVED